MWEIQTPMFIAQSAIEKILPQLPSICDALKIEKGGHRNGLFRSNPDGTTEVHVGEIHWDGSFILIFDHGVFKGFYQYRWISDGRDIDRHWSDADTLKLVA